MLKRVIEFINDVKKEINVKEVYVVGSRAGEINTSNIDLVIISKDFEGLNYIKRLEKFEKYLRPKISLRSH